MPNVGNCTEYSVAVISHVWLAHQVQEQALLNAEFCQRLSPFSRAYALLSPTAVPVGLKLLTSAVSIAHLEIVGHVQDVRGDGAQIC